MDIAKQIIDQRVNKIIEENSELFTDDDVEKKRSKAFLLLGVAAYLDIDVAEATQYMTDGGHDGGFDAAYIVEAQDSQLNVVMFQSKYVRDINKDSNFPANAVEKAVNTIKCVFDPDANIELNPRSKEKVHEIRSFILDGQIPYVTFVMLNNGLRWNQDGQNHIDNAFKGQNQVAFEHYCHSNIIRYIDKTKNINTQFILSGKAIQENFNFKRVILGRIPVMQIYNLMEEFGDSLLEKNIRRYLGKNSVNEGIIKTLLDKDKCQNFFFYNNGVTMICEKFSFNALQEQNWIIKINKLQIINGGQTCKTIHQTIRDNPDLDYSQVYVLIRLYEVSDDENIIQDITYATNSQNPVDFRDLKSNDDNQRLLEYNAKELGYVYKRKRDNQTNTDVIPSTVAAEAILAVWRECPHLAKYKKGEFFDKYYNLIFTEDLNASQMVIAVLIFRYCDNRRKKVSSDLGIQAQRPYSQYFLACMIGKMLLGHFNIELSKLMHTNFASIHAYYEDNKDELYKNAQNNLLKILVEYFSEQLAEIDGRTMAAVFRRFDIIERYLKNAAWWSASE